ncbi:hypothetical protein GCM10027091_41690 [Streptomyces daliensis]
MARVRTVTEKSADNVRRRVLPGMAEVSYQGGEVTGRRRGCGRGCGRAPERDEAAVSGEAGGVVCGEAL